MKRTAQPLLSKDGQQALDLYGQVLQQFEDISPVTIRNCLSDLRQFIAWCESFWSERQEGRSFTPPRHLNDDEEDVLVAAVYATGTLRDQTIITLLLHTGLRAQELCSLTRQQIHLGKRNGTLRIMRDLQQDVEKIAWI